MDAGGKAHLFPTIEIAVSQRRGLNRVLIGLCTAHCGVQWRGMEIMYYSNGTCRGGLGYHLTNYLDLSRKWRSFDQHMRLRGRDMRQL